MANKPHEFPKFTPLDKNTIDRLLLITTSYLKNIASVLNIPNTNDLIVSESILLEIFERVEKRRVYFHIFHDECKMGELNEGSLLCFWIAKLHPFFHPKIDTSVLNAKIAVCLFTNAIYYNSEKVKKEKRIPKHFIKDLFYSLLYRDISKEALMILAESFVDKLQ